MVFSQVVEIGSATVTTDFDRTQAKMILPWSIGLDPNQKITDSTLDITVQRTGGFGDITSSSKASVFLNGRFLDSQNWRFGDQNPKIFTIHDIQNLVKKDGTDNIIEIRVVSAVLDGFITWDTEALFFYELNTEEGPKDPVSKKPPETEEGTGGDGGGGFIDIFFGDAQRTATTITVLVAGGIAASIISSLKR